MRLFHAAFMKCGKRGQRIATQFFKLVCAHSLHMGFPL